MSTSTAQSHPASPLSGAITTELGRHEAWNLWATATLDEVALYSTALSAAQVQAHYTAGTTGSTSFIYNGDGQLVAKQVNGTTTTHYVAGGLVEKDLATSSTKYLYRFGGKLVAVRDVPSGGGAGTLHYVHQDHLGSASLQTSGSGTYERYEFRGPFGQPWASGESASTLATDLQYTDQRSFESSLGSLYFYGSRWYSPVVGRFLQPDSLVPGAGSRQTFNRFTYAQNNPIKFADPTGHDARVGPDPNAKRGDEYNGYKIEDDNTLVYGLWQHIGGDIIFVPFRDASDDDINVIIAEERQEGHVVVLGPNTRATNDSYIYYLNADPLGEQSEGSRGGLRPGEESARVPRGSGGDIVGGAGAAAALAALVTDLNATGVRVDARAVLYYHKRQIHLAVSATATWSAADTYQPSVRAAIGAGLVWYEYRFTGQQDDATVGLTYLRARYYDPSTGRFLSKDPWRGSPDTPITLNRYTYAANAPANATDPDGQCFRFLPHLALAGCAAVGAAGMVIWRLVAARGPVIGTAVTEVESEAPAAIEEVTPALNRASVDQLIEMMNKRPDVIASYAEDPEILRMLNGAEGVQMYVRTAEGATSYIDLDPNLATRATVFHEWLHRYFAVRGVVFDSIDAEHQVIEDFLARHAQLLGLE